MNFFLVCLRHKLNCKKNKVDDYHIGKPNSYSAQHLAAHLANVTNNEDFKDEPCPKPLSKSLVGGSMNICKTRVINFFQRERVVQGLLNKRVMFVCSFHLSILFSFFFQF